MKEVTVLMSVYNGEPYLREQLDSLLGQKGVRLSILARDDGSSDRSREILEEYQARGCLTWYTGENLRAARSFLHLLREAPQSDYYAFCDQDDYWLEDKVRIALDCLETLDENRPALYYGRPRLVSADLTPIYGSDRARDKMLDFKSALINSNATGCTMVFNRSLRDKVLEKTPDYLSMHDTWLHKVCIVTGGQLYFDEDVHILYRQHGSNAVGIPTSRWQRIRGHYSSFKTKECSRSRMVRSLLECYGSEMDEEEKRLAFLVAHYQDSVWNRIRLLSEKEIKTDYARRNRLYKMAVLLNIF